MDVNTCWWRHGKKGDLSVVSTYNALLKVDLDVDTTLYKEDMIIP